jgi:hypothetical protein
MAWADDIALLSGRAFRPVPPGAGVPVVLAALSHAVLITWSNHRA